MMSIFVIEEENAQPVPMYHTGGVKCADGLWEHHIAQTEGSSNSSAHNFADQGDVVLGMEAGSSPVSQMSEPSSPGGQPPSNRSGQRVAAKLKQGNSLLSKLREGSFREASRSFPRNEEAGGLRLAGDIRLEMSAKTYFWQRQSLQLPDTLGETHLDTLSCPARRQARSNVFALHWAAVSFSETIIFVLLD